MQIAFYNLDNTTNYTAVQKFACRILEKAYQQQEKIFVLCNTEDEAKILDELLWTHHDTAFIPHLLANQQEPDTPIKIGWQYQQREHETILVNISEVIPENHQQYNRIIEFVITAEPWRSKAKEKYRRYKSNGYEPVVHHIKNL